MLDRIIHWTNPVVDGTFVVEALDQEGINTHTDGSVLPELSFSYGRVIRTIEK